MSLDVRTSIPTRRQRVRDFGKCVFLNGTTAYISMTMTSGLPCTPGQQFSISFWCKVALRAGDRLFSQNNTSTANGNYNIFVSDTASKLSYVKMWVRNTGAVQQLLADATSPGLVANRWQHHVLTDNDGVVTYYIDGVEVSGGAFNYTKSGTYSLANFVFGAMVRNTTAGYANGAFDEIVVFKNKILTSAEVQDIFYSGIYPTSTKTGWWKLDENTGTTSTDSSGTGNTANLTNTSWSSDVFLRPRVTTTRSLFPGIGGKCIAVNGTSAYLSVALTSGLPCVPGEQFSVSFWAKISSLRSGDRIFTQDNSGTTNNNYNIYVSDQANELNYIRMWVRNSGGVQQLLASATTAGLVAGVWQHHVLTDSNGTVTYYINGTEVSGGAFNYTKSGTYTFNNLVFGALVRTTVAGWMPGNFDEIVIWKSKILSSTEVLDIYRADKYPTSTKTVWLQFEEPSGNSCYDRSRLANTGTLTNATRTTSVYRNKRYNVVDM